MLMALRSVHSLRQEKHFLTPEVQQILWSKVVNRLSKKCGIWQVPDVLIRTPLTCQQRNGICATCYGEPGDLGDLVDLGGDC